MTRAETRIVGNLPAPFREQKWYQRHGRKSLKRGLFSSAQYAAMCSLIRSGYTYAETLQLFEHFTFPGRYHDLKAKDGEKRAREYLNQSWQSAKTFVASHDNATVQQARELQAWAHSRPWPGRTGATDRAIFLAHLAIIEKCGQSPHGASVRELAELAGVNWKTVSRSNHRLVGAGLLAVDTLSTASLSTRFLTVSQCHTLLTPFCGGVCHYDTSQNHDTFRRSGLGQTGYAVWCYLKSQKESKTVAEIAKATGRSRMTVHRKVKAMFRLGMVEPDGKSSWLAVDGVDLDRIAQELGTFGAGEAQRKKHEHERRLHRTVLDVGKVKRR